MTSQDSPGPVLPTHKTRSTVKMVTGTKQRQNTRFAQFKLQENVKGRERGSARATGCQASAGNTCLCPVLQGLEQDQPTHTCLPDAVLCLPPGLAPPSGLALTTRGDPGAVCSLLSVLDLSPKMAGHLPTSPGSGPSSGKPSWLPPSAASLFGSIPSLHPGAAPSCVLWNTGPGCTTRMWGPWVFPLWYLAAGKKVGKSLLLSRRIESL